MKKVLFICQGNIGRSQIAEGFFNSLQHEYLGISGGIDDVGAKYDYKPFPPIIELMKKKHNVDISHQITKQVKEDCIGVEKIMLFCEQKECQNIIPDYILNHSGYIYSPTQDPHHLSGYGIENIIDEIYTKVLLLIKTLE